MAMRTPWSAARVVSGRRNEHWPHAILRAQRHPHALDRRASLDIDARRHQRRARTAREPNLCVFANQPRFGATYDGFIDRKAQMACKAKAAWMGNALTISNDQIGLDG